MPSSNQYDKDNNVCIVYVCVIILIYRHSYKIFYYSLGSYSSEALNQDIGSVLSLCCYLKTFKNEKKMHILYTVSEKWYEHKPKTVTKNENVWVIKCLRIFQWMLSVAFCHWICFVCLSSG